MADNITIESIREARAKVPTGDWRYVASDNLVELSRGGRLIDFATPRSLAVSEAERNAMGEWIVNSPVFVDYLMERLDAVERARRLNEPSIQVKQKHYS